MIRFVFVQSKVGGTTCTRCPSAGKANCAAIGYVGCLFRVCDNMHFFGVFRSHATCTIAQGFKCIKCPCGRFHALAEHQDETTQKPSVVPYWKRIQCVGCPIGRYGGVDTAKTGGDDDYLYTGTRLHEGRHEQGDVKEAYCGGGCRACPAGKTTSGTGAGSSSLCNVDEKAIP